MNRKKMAGELSPRQIKSLNARINNYARKEANRRDCSVEFVRHQVVFECFLRRLFTPGNNWVLTGGSALLMRQGDGRATRDIDLSRKEAWSDKEEIEQEFSRIGESNSDLDPFTFDVTRVETMRDEDPTGYSGPALNVAVVAQLGSVRFSNFTIDVTTRRHTQEPISRITVNPILGKALGGRDESFSVDVTPIEAQLADKICAMYERHPGKIYEESTRFHDLADIVTIVQTWPFSAELLREKLHHESKKRRLDRPSAMVSPGPYWDKNFAGNAPDYRGLPERLYPLETALGYVGGVPQPST